jgi:anaerobic magnesium-protoporphyrin IX monomethyl ester cyclase
MDLKVYKKIISKKEVKNKNVKTLINKLSVFITLSDGVSNRFFPLGARYIIRLIEDYHKVVFLQDRIISRNNILKKIDSLSPNLIWISIQPSAENLFFFIKNISKIYFGTIILGNIGSRWITQEQLIELNLNIIVVLGQGEDATKELIILNDKGLLNINYIREIPNIYGYMNNIYFQNKLEKKVNNQQIIPSSNGLSEAIKRGDIITVRTSSGCNFNCIFCSVKDINNGQKWKQFDNNILYLTLQNIIDNGMNNGVIRFIDDDTAVSLDYLLSISETFKDINQKNNTNLQYGFATNAIHLYNPNDTKEKRKFRKFVWKQVVKNGLKDLFLGLESGSTTQLKRLGKNTNSDINYNAYNFVKTLNINLEIGFIPIDPLMNDNNWKSEFLDNIKLAKYVEVYLSSPTWLSTIRVYENSPLKRSLKNNNLLLDKIKYTNEYNFNYLSIEVKEFIHHLGICLCDDDVNNGLYRLKRELKNIIRYDTQHSKDFVTLIKSFSFDLINLEFNYIECIISKTDIFKYKQDFIKNLLILLFNLEKELSSFSVEVYFDKIKLSLKMAIKTTNEWKEYNN